MSEEETVVPAEWYALAEADLGVCKVLLLSDLIKFEPDFAEFMPACVKISAYYSDVRYSLRLSSALTRAEVEESLAQGEALIARLKSRATPPPPPPPAPEA